MKYLKIFAFLIAVVSLAACSDDDKPTFNSKGGVTVCMEDADLNFLETKGIVKVPFEVKGERNGYISVTCNVSELQPEVAMEDVHYLVTSYTVNVDTMDNSGYFEIKLVDDPDPNEDRRFQVTLASAEGATISGLETTIITIKDNDRDPYLRLGGDWRVPCLDWYGKQQPDLKVHFDIFDESEYGYYKFYYITGLVSISSDVEAKVKADFIYDNQTMEGEINIAYGQQFDPVTVSERTFTTKLGSLIVEDGSLYIGATSGKAVYTWNENGRELALVSWPGAGSVAWDGASYVVLGLEGGQISTWFGDQVDGIEYMYKIIK